MSGAPSYVQVLTAQRAAVTIVSNSAVANSIIDQQDLVTLSPGWLFPGAQFTIEMDGAISVVAGGSPTFTFNLMFGAIAVWSSGAIPTLATVASLLAFKMKLDLRLDSVGISNAAKFIGTAGFDCAAMVNARQVVPTTSPAPGTGFNSTIANIADMQCTMSVANAGNGVRVDNYKFLQHRFGG